MINTGYLTPVRVTRPLPWNENRPRCVVIAIHSSVARSKPSSEPLCLPKTALKQLAEGGEDHHDDVVGESCQHKGLDGQCGYLDQYDQYLIGCESSQWRAVRRCDECNYPGSTNT